MRKRERIYHFIGWSVYLSYVLVGELFGITRSHHPWDFTILLIRFLEFYLCYLWVFPKFLNAGKAPQLIGGIFLVVIFFIVTRYLMEEVASKYFFHIHNYGEGTTILYYILDNIYWASLYIILSAVVYLGFDSLHKGEENRSLREEKVRAELAFLKSQINPHFLYNTLNYIYSLAIPLSEELGNVIIKLSRLMQYMLTNYADGAVAIVNEVDYIENYIVLYRLRFEKVFFVNFNIHGNLEGKKIASLILIPFVENAFKHGIVNDPDFPIIIDLAIEGGKLIFIVTNRINRKEKDNTTGIGLPNIRRRLELIYPGRHELLIVSEDDRYKANLTIQL